jgi:5-methylcytosine-specific restriction endonuclease McrA
MTSIQITFADLSDEQLLATVKRLAAAERRTTAALIRALMELDARRLYLGEGCSSLFTYCTQVLHLAEGAAYNRIEAARAARRWPLIVEQLEDASLTLTAVRLLAPHLTDDNHRGVLASAKHKSKADIERLVASLQPRPPVPTIVRKLPEFHHRAAEMMVAAHTTPAMQRPSASTRPGASPTRPTVVPLAPERYKIQLTISRETHDKLRRVQALARHTSPSGDLAEIVDRAVTLLLDDLERRRCAATSSPRSSRTATDGSRHIPAAVKRAVWPRDDGQCAFVGRSGRCAERGFLEFHHVQPYAVGGAATTTNIQLRCQAHNNYEASLFFGGEAPELVGQKDERPNS